MHDYLALTLAGERARIYREGGIGYDRYTSREVGWVVEDEPSDTIQRIAEAARAAFLAESP